MIKILEVVENFQQLFGWGKHAVEEFEMFISIASSNFTRLTFVDLICSVLFRGVPREACSSCLSSKRHHNEQVYFYCLAEQSGTIYLKYGPTFVITLFMHLPKFEHNVAYVTIDRRMEVFASVCTSAAGDPLDSASICSAMTLLQCIKLL